ncbi:MAG: glycerophosphodiester phosphodiesterase [Ilumatobacteraceae bacterium]
MQQRLPSLLDRPIGFAHRGARAHAPENTLEAFQLGLRLGATGLESDVWLTSDGVPVLDHDGVVRHRRRRRPLSGYRRDELPEHIPSLADLVATCGTGYELSLDLKTADTGLATIKVLRDVAPDLLGRTWLCHQDPALLAELRTFDETVRLVNSTKLERMKQGPERRAAELADLAIDAVNLHHSQWTGGLTTLFHRFDRAAFAWDLQFEHLLRNVIRMGIDGVFSDHVDVMTDALRSELGSP